jgi:hypothetical protein
MGFSPGEIMEESGLQKKRLPPLGEQKRRGTFHTEGTEERTQSSQRREPQEKASGLKA